MAGLNFYINDAYPNLGVQNTRTMVQPEAYDQKAIDGDDAAAREQMEAETRGGTPAKKIYMAVAIMALLALGLGLMHD